MSARDAETSEGTPVPEAQRSGMTDRQLRDEMMTLLIAGHETVASALAWTWYLLATDPAAEAKLHAELAAVLGGRTPQVDDLPDLRYTQAVFEEALRLYPPAWIITRKALADDEIGGYRVPANALVVASPYVTHRQAALWPDPEAFDPDRFRRSDRRPAALRLLPVRRRAQAVHRRSVRHDRGEAGHRDGRPALPPETRARPPIAVEPGVTLRPKHGLLMRIEPRDVASQASILASRPGREASAGFSASASDRLKPHAQKII